MQIHTLALGAFQANCYLITDDQACAVIDPGGDAERLLAQLTTLGVAPALILLTHGHPDHIAAACALRAATGARVLAHAGDRAWVEHPHPYMAQLVGGVEDCAVDGELTDDQELEVGECRLRVLHTPGHSPGCVCFLALQADGAGVVFTGDTLFAGSVGRTDLQGGDWGTLAESLKRLVAVTTPQTVVYPGHGPATTIGEELQTNPYLRDLG